MEPKTEEEYEEEIKELESHYVPMSQEEFWDKLNRTVAKWHEKEEEDGNDTEDGS